MLADAKRAAVLETLELDLRMIGARGVDDERAEPIAALDRSLRDVDVLHARSRHVDHDAPVDALADLNALVVDAIGGVLIRARRPAIGVPRQEQHEEQPRRRHHDPPQAAHIVIAQQVEEDAHGRSDGDHGGKDAAGDSLQRNHPRIELVLTTIGHDRIVAHGPNCMRLRVALG